MLCDSEIDTYTHNCNRHILQYTHNCNIRISVNASATFKFYQVIWNDENELKNFLIHLIDLIEFTEFFGMIGMLKSGSGYEDTKCRAELCTTGTVEGILSGKHCSQT